MTLHPPTVGDPDRLPDGSRFASWEPAAWTWRRTYHVAADHPAADDAGPGSAQRPWRTIQRAADQLEPGDRVLIRGGEYREHVRPARGGEGPEAMIGYEAAAGETVVITATEPYRGEWTPSDRWRPIALAPAPVWQIRLPAAGFVGCQPFAALNIAQENLTRSSIAAFPPERVPPMLLKRGLLFQDGRRLRQVLEPEELAAAEAEGSYFVEAGGRWVHLRPWGDRDPRACGWTYSAREQCFAPEVEGLRYIRVAGITVTGCGNEFPRPQRGAISCSRGTHWVIEDCRAHGINSVGIDVSYGGHPKLSEDAQGGDCVIRGCRVSDCGVLGIAATGHPMHRLLVEDNLVEACGWHGAERIWEAAGIKCHNTRDSLFRRNRIVGCRDAAGLWLDWDIRNTRAWGNVIVDTASIFGGIFIEAAKHRRSELDHNLIVGSRRVPPLQAAAGDAASAGGHGIYEHDSDRLHVHHNLLADCDGDAICLRLGQVRRIAAGRGATCRGHLVERNLVVGGGRCVHLGRVNDNRFAGNVYAVPTRAPFEIAEPVEQLDLDAWSEFHGFDADGRAVAASVQLGPDGSWLELQLEEACHGVGPWPELPAGRTRVALARPAGA